MRFYTETHHHYCGIDLHAKSMYLCILDREGEIVLHKNLRSAPEPFLAAIEPFRDDLVVAVECMFTWYWLADLCRKEGIEFVLGHALYMKAIHGAKAKNDKVDAFKIAALLRGGNFPLAYAYPPEMRATRDLLRRRLHLVRRRGNLLAHIQNTHHQYNLPVPAAKIAYKANRIGVAEAFTDPDVRKSLEINNEAGQRHLRRLAGRHGKGKALSILAAKLGRAVYFMLRQDRPFEMDRFFGRTA